MTSKVSPLDWQSPIVDPETGRPTQLFITAWNLLLTLGLGDLQDVFLQGTPADGYTLTYSAAEAKWIAS